MLALLCYADHETEETLQSKMELVFRCLNWDTDMEANGSNEHAPDALALLRRLFSALVTIGWLDTPPSDAEGVAMVERMLLDCPPSDDVAETCRRARKFSEDCSAAAASTGPLPVTGVAKTTFVAWALKQHRDASGLLAAATRLHVLGDVPDVSFG